MEFSRPEHWSGWPFPSPGDLPNPGIGSPTRRPGSQPRSPALQIDSFPAELLGNPTEDYLNLNYLNKHKVKFLRCNNQTLRVQKHIGLFIIQNRYRKFLSTQTFLMVQLCSKLSKNTKKSLWRFFPPKMYFLLALNEEFTDIAIS